MTYDIDDDSTMVSDEFSGEYVNENYIVMVNSEDSILEGPDDIPYEGFYEVINRSTGIVEFKTASLPGAVSTAYNLNAALNDEPWAWRDRQPPEEPPTGPTVLN